MHAKWLAWKLVAISNYFNLLEKEKLLHTKKIKDFFPLIMAHSNFRLYFVVGINELFLDHLFLLNATGSEAFPGDQLDSLHD